MAIKLGMLLVFFAVMLVIGLYCRQHASDVNGFVLGGRSVGPWLTAFAYGTSYFSAVVFVGYAGQFGWKYGIAATWAGIGNALLGSLLAWVVLGRRTRIMTQHLDSATMPEFFGKRFGSDKLKYLGTIQCFFWATNLVNCVNRLSSGVLLPSTLLLAVPGIAGQFIGMAIGSKVVDRIRADQFRLFVYAFLGIAGVLTCITGLSGR